MIVIVNGFTGRLYIFSRRICYNEGYGKAVCEKTIEINAPASKVWNVLTRREYTDQWAPEFTGGAEFHIESEDRSPVLWKDKMAM